MSGDENSLSAALVLEEVKARLEAEQQVCRQLTAERDALLQRLADAEVRRTTVGVLV